MTAPAHNDDHYHSFVRKAVRILAAALGPVVARMMADKGLDRYSNRSGGERPLSTLADTPDASEVLGAMRDYWRQVFQPHFEHPRNQRVRQMVYDVLSIRHRYVGEHPNAECDYEPHDALGVIARLLRQFSADEAVQQVNELMGELGILMYGQPTGATPSAGGDNIILTSDALAMLIADTVSQEVARQLRSEPDLASWHSLEDGGPPTPNTTLALPSSTVSPVVASSEADATPVAVPASAIEDTAPVSAENARLANDAFNRGNAHVKQGDYDQAIAEYTAAIEMDPQNAYAYYIIRGYAYGAQGNYHLAIADYTAAIGLNSQFAWAYYNRGIAYAKQGEYGQAVADYTAAIGLNPQLADAYMLRGLAYGVQGKYDQAVADYTAVIGLNPQLADAYMLRGFAYGGQGKYGLAIEDYTSAIDLGTQDAQAYNCRGRSYAEQGEYDLAIEDYFAAIELDPEFAQAYNHRGRAYAEQGEYDLAIEDYFAAIELDPELTNAYFNRGVAYFMQREFDWAVADYTVVIGLNSQDASAYITRGVAYVLLGECERAIEDIDRAISMSPDSDTYSEVRDHVVRLCGDSAEYDRAIADDPDAPENWHLRGLYYSEREEYGRAVDDYSVALMLGASGGDAAAIYSDRGLAWARLGDDERAMADFDRAIDANPNLAEAWYNRGLAWRRRGEHGNAVLDFTAAIEVRADYALAYYGRSISHGVLGNGEKAAADLERARELGFQA